ncbi:abhydrolase domain containing 5, isoform CRA_a [Mus musculus]|nr:abhydrolase domain containing 5, isoform CRA_a [Mus musculus]
MKAMAAEEEVDSADAGGGRLARKNDAATGSFRTHVYWESLIAEAKRPQAQNWCCLYRPRRGMTHTRIGCAWVMLITSFA